MEPGISCVVLFDEDDKVMKFSWYTRGMHTYVYYEQ